MNLINFLGVGTVASTKQTNTDEIMVYLPGFAPAADGRVVAAVKEVEQVSENAYGEETTSRQLSSNTFPAEWRSMGDSNRITPPDVREGSQVAIYNVSGQNTYYWTTFGVNAETMRLETVVMGWSANPAIGDDTPFNIDNFYTMTVSTHEGFFALRTTQLNNEKTTFEVKVDAMNGRIMIGGGFKNYAVFDDVERSFTYQNADKSIWSVNKKKIVGYAADSISLKADEQINFMTKTMNIVTEELAIKANHAEFEITTTDWRGDINHIGDTDQEGDYTQKGDYDQAGDTTRTGDSTSTGTVQGLTDVTTATVSLNLHVHAGVENGDGETTPPVPA